MFELIAAAAGLGLGAWFLLASDAGPRARIGVALLLVIAVVLRLGYGHRIAATLLFAAVAVAVLMFRRFRGQD